MYHSYPLFTPSPPGEGWGLWVISKIYQYILFISYRNTSQHFVV